MSSGQRTARLAGVVVVAAALMHALLYLGWMLDDAYISFRYARHLAQGDGLVFNVGERVEGYTNFLWVLLCAAGLRVGVAPELLTPALSLASAIALLFVARAASKWLSTRDGGAPENPATALPAMTVIALTQSFALYGSNGLETVFFALWVALAAWSMAARWPLRFAGFTALAFLTRPEAGLVGAAGVGLFALDASRDPAKRAPLAKAVGALSLAVAPYLAWKLSWFGALLPNTFHAKPGEAGVGLRYVLFGIGPLLAALALTLREQTSNTSSRREERELLGLGLAMLVAAAVEGGDWMPAFRLLAPATAVLAMAVDGPLSRALAVDGQPRTLAALALALCVGWNALRTRTDLDVVPVVAQHEAHLVALATALRRVGVRSVALTDVGRVGWILDRAAVTDLGGLTDATIARAPGSLLAKRISNAYLTARSPEVVLLNSRMPVQAMPGAPLPAVAPMWKVERSVLATPWFQTRARYACSMVVNEQHFVHVFERADLPPRVAGSTPLCAPLVIPSRTR